MKRYIRRKGYKAKIMLILLFIILICVMAGKMALNSDFGLPSFRNEIHHTANEEYGWRAQKYGLFVREMRHKISIFFQSF